MKRLFPVLLSIILFSACSSAPEEVDLATVLPEGGVNELTNNWPDMRAILVTDSQIGVPVGDLFLEVEGIDDEGARAEMAAWIASFLNDPEKKARQVREREEYDALPASEKLAQFVKRMAEYYEGFSYEWVSLEDGNSFVEYGDNGLLLTGVEEEGALREIGNFIYRLQQEIDASHTGEQK